ncbi:hypothetical protein AMS68_004710 [Peltaster fructicola]|uniref:Uncharacterized protein n=1 Tax=Peltaster fructicola TaxID=286661 RepID=A0A6H0XWR6_9PEZI|nr:hypothetical protein AMS68_004710 [Peltaster fructicola]
MQRIINGVAQQVLGTCRCPQCTGHAGHAVRSFGRSNVNARPRFTTSSTYWLSGIFAAAATFDAGQKIRRRDKWDEAIAEKKRELSYSIAAEEIVVPEQASEVLAIGDAQHVIRNEPIVCNFASHGLEDAHMHHASPGHRTPTKTKRSHKAQLLDELRNPQHYADLVDPSATLLEQVLEEQPRSIHTGSTLKQHRLAPESVYLSKRLKSHDRSSWTPKKAEIVNLSTNLLQMTILLHLYDTKYLVDYEDMPTTIQDLLKLPQKQLLNENRNLLQDLKRAWKALPDLRDYQRREPTITLARYASQDTSPSWFKPPSHLSQELRNNFAATRKEIQENLMIDAQSARHENVTAVIRLLASTFHSLNTSRTSPDLMTYNIMIAGFSDNNLKTLTGHTIAALRRCQLRPNETTVATVLQHYLKYGDADRFNRWIDLFNGENGGLSLSRHQEIRESQLSSQLRVKDGFAHKIVQLQQVSSKVLSAMIAGTLHFRGLDAALEQCDLSGSRDSPLNMHTFGPLLRDCAARRDMDNGKRFWAGVCELKARARIVASRGQRPEPIPRHVFAAMLNLCQRMEDRELYAQIADQAQDAWPGELQTIMRINKTCQQASTNNGLEQHVVESGPPSVVVMHERHHELQEESSQPPSGNHDAQDEEEQTQYAYAAKRPPEASVRWNDTRQRSWSRQDGRSIYTPPLHAAQEQYLML